MFGYINEESAVVFDFTSVGDVEGSIEIPEHVVISMEYLFTKCILGDLSNSQIYSVLQRIYVETDEGDYETIPTLIMDIIVSMGGVIISSSVGTKDWEIVYTYNGETSSLVSLI